MKKIAILTAWSLTALLAHAQGNPIGDVLNQIGRNNPQLKAYTQNVEAQKLENRSGNNLPNPTVSYAHLWDSKDSQKTVGELVVAQSFEFPTLYAGRNRLNKTLNHTLDAQANAQRQDVLLQAQTVCLDLIMLHQQQMLLDERLKNAEELSALYAKRLQEGDANRMEINKINLELLNIRTETRLNRTAWENKLKELQTLNGNQPVSVEGLNAYPAMPLPADFAPVCKELLAADATLQAAQSTTDAARRNLSLSKQGWLPQLELGYRRNTEDGHPLNGMVVGFSIPIFENRLKVKTARARQQEAKWNQENTQLAAESALWQQYDEARALQASINEYQEAFGQGQDLALLKQALTGGQISLIEYFVEISTIYQSKANMLQIENQYQKAMATLYKSKL